MKKKFENMKNIEVNTKKNVALVINHATNSSCEVIIMQNSCIYL